MYFYTRKGGWVPHTLPQNTPFLLHFCQEWFSLSVICLIKCTFLRSDTLPKSIFYGPFESIRSKVVPWENDLCQAHNSKFLEVNHSCFLSKITALMIEHLRYHIVSAPHPSGWVVQGQPCTQQQVFAIFIAFGGVKTWVCVVFIFPPPCHKY